MRCHDTPAVHVSIAPDTETSVTADNSQYSKQDFLSFDMAWGVSGSEEDSPKMNILNVTWLQPKGYYQDDLGSENLTLLAETTSRLCDTYLATYTADISHKTGVQNVAYSTSNERKYDFPTSNSIHFETDHTVDLELQETSWRHFQIFCTREIA